MKLQNNTIYQYIDWVKGKISGSRSWNTDRGQARSVHHEGSQIFTWPVQPNSVNNYFNTLSHQQIYQSILELFALDQSLVVWVCILGQNCPQTLKKNCRAYLPCAFPSRRWCNCNAIFCFASLGWSCVLIHCAGRHVFSLLRNDASDSHFTFGCIQNKVFILYMCVFLFIVHITCCNLFQLFRCFWI